MVAVKVWLGGEGNNDLGGIGEIGAIEALFRRVEPQGWVVDGKTAWWTLRKYRAGGAIRMPTGHGDAKNAAKLVLIAWEAGAEVLAFTRDQDVDDDRPEALQNGMAAAADLPIAIVGGIAKPSIEGWIAALLGVRGTDEMSRVRVVGELGARGTVLKETGGYVEIIEQSHVGARLQDRLPPGCNSLSAWLDLAESVLGAAVRGA